MTKAVWQAVLFLVGLAALIAIVGVFVLALMVLGWL